MKKRSEATQTLRAGCSKADPQTDTETDRGDYNTLRSLAQLPSLGKSDGRTVGYINHVHMHQRRCSVSADRPNNMKLVHNLVTRG